MQQKLKCAAKKKFNTYNITCKKGTKSQTHINKVRLNSKLSANHSINKLLLFEIIYKLFINLIKSIIQNIINIEKININIRLCSVWYKIQLFWLSRDLNNRPDNRVTTHQGLGEWTPGKQLRYPAGLRWRGDWVN